MEKRMAFNLAMFGLLIMAVQSTPSATASPPTQCQHLVGTQANSASISDILNSLAVAGVKGEFESTIAYNQRVAQAEQSLVGERYIEVENIDRQSMTYNADSETFSLKVSTVDRTPFDAWMSASISNRIPTIRISPFLNVASLLKSVDSDQQIYSGQNGYGAPIQIAKYSRSYFGIFDRNTSMRVRHLFRGAANENSEIGMIKVQTSQARHFKETFSAAFLVVPRSPMLIGISAPPSRPTMQSPEEVSINYIMLNADIKCLVIMGDTKNIVAAFDTN
jgi:hypothetical protein